MMSRTDEPTEQETGLPPKELKNSTPSLNFEAILSVVITAPIG